MREIRPSGSEGGVAFGSLLPLSVSALLESTAIELVGHLPSHFGDFSYFQDAPTSPLIVIVVSFGQRL